MVLKSISPEPVLDIEGTLARFGGDKALFVEMSGILQEDAPRLVADLRRAVVASDSTAIRSHAHALKGLLAGCGGVRAASVAQSLEDAGNESNLSRVATLLEQLIDALDQLARALRQYRL